MLDVVCDLRNNTYAERDAFTPSFKPFDFTIKENERDQFEAFSN